MNWAVHRAHFYQFINCEGKEVNSKTVIKCAPSVRLFCGAHRKRACQIPLFFPCKLPLECRFLQGKKKERKIYRAFLPHQFVWVETDVWWQAEVLSRIWTLDVASNYGYNYTVCVLSPETPFRAPECNTVWDNLGNIFGGEEGNPVRFRGRDSSSSSLYLNPNVNQMKTKWHLNPLLLPSWLTGVNTNYAKVYFLDFMTRLAYFGINFTVFIYGYSPLLLTGSFKYCLKNICHIITAAVFTFWLWWLFYESVKYIYI